MAARVPDQVRLVRRTIVAAEAALRRRWSVLRYQDALGLAFWIVALGAMAGTALLYLNGLMPAVLAIVVNALAASVLHELEHDLIHNLYFRHAPWVQNLMFTGAWLGKTSLNPWNRRELHLRHHRVSGQHGDVEERLIGLGEKRLWLRILTSFLPLLAVVAYLPRTMRAAVDWRPLAPGLFTLARWRQRLDVAFGVAPIVLAILALQGRTWAMSVLVLLVLPNLVRHGSLALLSSYTHYYGDIPEHDVTVQNQILRHPLLWPLQIFCWNFGATHILHHYYVPQPFFIRHLVRREAWQALESIGTRVNDAGIVKRANRYTI